jgi:uncharacterized membrane protein
MASIDTLYPKVSQVLRIGFRIAAAFLVSGIVIALIRQEPLATEVDSFSKIPGALMDLRSRAFIDLAIIVIVLTPVAAVVAIWRGFLAQGERRFANYTLGVLGVLGASIVLSLFR